MKGSSTDDPSSNRPYGTARDLPSFREMEQFLAGGKFLTRVIARDQRQELLKIEAEIVRLADVVDEFYDRLGPRNWVFHDMLSVDKIELLLSETSNPEDSERRLIEMYRDPDSSMWWTMRVRSHEGLKARYGQIERAQQHYKDDQFDSCVLQLVAVMDGFVNDFEPGARKGLTSRDPDAMTAWDSVVGHHMGLTHALKTFTKTIKKRVDEEVTDVYRHGIMHGSVVNFDNVVVATKAWNLLYAVADWAAATTKAAKPTAPQPTFREVMSKVARSSRYKRVNENFEPREIDLRYPEAEDETAIEAVFGFLAAWKRGRWSEVADFQPPQLRGSRRPGELARDAKATFERYGLSGYEVHSIIRDMASTIAVQASGVVEGERRDFTFRMMSQTEDQQLALPEDENVVWTVCIWAPFRWFEDTHG